MRVAIAIAIVLGFAFPAFADSSRDEDARKAKDFSQKAERNRANTILFAQVLCVSGGAFIVWVAIGVARHGLGVGPRPRRILGQGKWIAATVVGGLGLAIGIGGPLYVSALLYPS